MLSENQANVLKDILDNNENLIIDLAIKNNISDPDASIGVAKFLVGNPENFSSMKPKQKYHYDNAIEPLINDVPCAGPVGEYHSCRGNGFIEEDGLLWAYRGQDMHCQECIGEEDRWFAENP